MRILVISLHEQQIGGGEGRLAFEFAVEMSKHHQVVLMYPGTAPGSLPADARLQVYTIRSIDSTIPALRGGELRSIFHFLDEFRPDVIHSHTPWFLGAIIQEWAFVNGVPFYFTAHELPTKILGWGLVRYWRSFLQSGLMRMLTRTYIVSFCRHCTGVVALNKAAADDIRSIRYRGRLYIIPNGRTMALYDGKAPADIRSMEKILAFVGDVIPRKNQKYLVKMMSFLPPDYRLLLIGHDVDHHYRREIDSMMGPDIRQRVTFTGRLDHSRVPEHLAKTHLWVSASLREVQSLAVMEALASGTPVLGLSNETIDEMVDSRVGMRLMKDATPEQFAAAVRSLCETDGETYQGMCKSARERVQPYDWANSVRMTERMYQQSSRGRGTTRRGTLAIPLLLATAEMLLVMTFFRILQLVTLVERLQRPKRA
ncbi:MAG: glycosyltransferase [Spirochaetia bacterium]|jgi:glycosyltransferase involved in cell wall biosynthesis